MTNRFDQFWEIFKSVSGETGDVTTAMDSIAKSDRTKIEDYFTHVIDQYTFSTDDYYRIRRFLIDLFATHRSITTQSLRSTEPRVLNNSDLDELFRSFGYPYSSQLRDFTENPLEQKVQFFLDLVNLYKVKGTPQSLVDVLQYYGVSQVDIYEFFLRFEGSKDNLIFDGKAVAGTTANPGDTLIPFDNLTATDPHWLYTKDQIVQLHDNIKINLPSKTPYIGIQPVVDLVGPEMSVISRFIQDQYAYWIDNNELPPQNARITVLGETCSFLELYLCTIYLFNQVYSTGAYSGDRFLCYNGTSQFPVEILQEYENLTDGVFTRDSLKTTYQEYLNLFSRLSTTNFLVDETTAETIISSMSPHLKDGLDNILDKEATVFSLLKDLSDWVQINIGLGFVNFGFILFGINEFFNELKPVIDFFKPLRARLVLLESLQIKNRLFSSVIVEDMAFLDIEMDTVDFVTGDSKPCCDFDNYDSTCYLDIVPKYSRQFVMQPPASFTWKGLWENNVQYLVNDVVSGSMNGRQYICKVDHLSAYGTKPPYSQFWDILSEIVYTGETDQVAYYSRDTFDCGSYFDIGAATDVRKQPLTEIYDTYFDVLRCPDETGVTNVFSEMFAAIYIPVYVLPIELHNNTKVVGFNTPTPHTNYILGVGLNNLNLNSHVYSYMITYKTTTSFAVRLSAPAANEDYNIEWFMTFDHPYSGNVSLSTGELQKTISVFPPKPTNDYVVSVTFKNTIDAVPHIYSYKIINKTTDEFTVLFSGPIANDNYEIEWVIPDSQDSGVTPIPKGTKDITIGFNNPDGLPFKDFPTLINLIEDSTTNHIYPHIITNKTNHSFTVEFSGPIKTDNAVIHWSVFFGEALDLESFSYYQTGGFTSLDDGGVFDCIFSYDFANITVENVTDFLLQENGFYLLQENDGRILL